TELRPRGRGAGLKGGPPPSQGQPGRATNFARSALFSARIVGQTGSESSIRASSLASGQARGSLEEGPIMATAPGKSATPTTVTLKHLAAALAEAHEMSKKQAEEVLGDLVGNIVKHLKKGERIRIGGLGILQVRKRAARMGRNPATGEAIQIKASKKVAFRASKDLKEAV